MKETFLKVIFILIAAAIVVPLLISMWPRQTVVVKEDRALTNTVIVPNEWVKYEVEDFTFWHPPRITEHTTAGVSGFTSVDDEVALVTFADESTILKDTDAPFDGFTLYSYDLAKVRADVTLEEFIGAEKVQMEKNYKAMTGDQNVPAITSSQIMLGDNDVTKVVTPFETIVMYYVRVPSTSEVLLFSGVERNSNSFLPELEDIIETLEIQ